MWNSHFHTTRQLSTQHGARTYMGFLDLDIDPVESTLSIISATIDAVSDPEVIKQLVSAIRKKIEQIHPEHEQENRLKLVGASVVAFALGMIYGMYGRQRNNRSRYSPE